MTVSWTLVRKDLLSGNVNIKVECINRSTECKINELTLPLCSELVALNLKTLQPLILKEKNLPLFIWMTP